MAVLTSSGYGAISALAPTQVYRTAKGKEPRIRASGETQNKFDSVNLSAPTSGEDKFRMALVGRLTQEVRAANTTGDIAALRAQVSSGAYTPDPMAIARRMLLLGEDA